MWGIPGKPQYTGEELAKQKFKRVLPKPAAAAATKPAAPAATPAPVAKAQAPVAKAQIDSMSAKEMRTKLMAELDKLSLELEAMKKMEQEKGDRINAIRAEIEMATAPVKKEAAPAPVVAAAPAKVAQTVAPVAAPQAKVETTPEAAQPAQVQAQVTKHHHHHHHKTAAAL